jgi:hypothetical protein
MIGLTIIAFVLTIAVTMATLAGVANAELLSIVAVALAAFTISCVIASWLTWEPRHARDRFRHSLDDSRRLPPDPDEEDASVSGPTAHGPRGWPW